MDEYIEYAERRYSRMHPRHQRQQQQRQQQQQQRVSGARRSKAKLILDFHLPRKIFLSIIALQTPQQTSPASSSANNNRPAAAAAAAATEEEEEEDPLIALGLSGLASPRLRQRLHVPRDLRDEHTLLTSGATGAVNFIAHYCASAAAASTGAAAPSAPGNAATAKTSTAAVPDGQEKQQLSGGRNASYASLSFPEQLRLLKSTLSRLVLAFARTLALLASFATRAFSAVLEGGGFRTTARAAAAMAVAIVLMFRPLFGGAMRQG